MASELVKKVFWYLCLVGVLVLLGWGLTILTDKVEYKWYWNRVPHNFFFNGPVDQFAKNDGVVSVITKNGELSEIKITYDNSTVELVEVETKSLRIEAGKRVNENTELGYIKVWQQGILIKGLLLTLKFSIYATFFGMIIGLFAGLGRISSNPMIKGLSTIYVELIRGTPLLVQVFIIYYFLATVLGFGRTSSGVIALSVFAGAYVAEIVRAGIQSIDPGQMEAARSLGMNYFQSMGYIILPQAFKRIMPPLAGQFISLIKDSSLLSVIAITELTKAGREIITSTFAVFEIWFTVAALYLLLTFPLSMFVRYIERRFSVSD
ncbi:MAG: amino acid ABC transporter permease [Proteobacteria bacterium]|nr:amino acid ABC transporter permease [Pseudomonadota bacterium]